MQQQTDKDTATNLAIHGHAIIEEMLYTVNGVFHKVPGPSGALFVQEVLRHLQTQGLELPMPQSNIISALDHNIFKDSDEYRREYKALHRYEDGNRRDYYAISRYLGYSEGKSAHNIYWVPPNCPDAPADVIIWDEGLGGLTPPSDCRSALWASNKALPDTEQFKAISGKCFLFADVNVLRSAGAMISRQISWERTAADLIWQLQNNPAISYLWEAAHILISFAEDGAVYIHHSGGQVEASLILTHGRAEGSLRERVRGQIDNTFAMMTAVVGCLFTGFLSGEVKPESLRQALALGESFMLSGYSVGEVSDDISIHVELSTKNWANFSIPLVLDGFTHNVDVPPDWTIVDNVGEERQLADIALEYVIKGAEVIDGLPQLSFGALTTIDRWEIEAYQNIRNLIVGYAGSDSLRPLSIAVFGSPGSGKSFGVTQIAQNVLPGKVEKLEFNVSQFASIADLGAAFQSVRDTILAGKLPLVIFDEFDSDRDGLPLGWVKSFLMPMQDGKFRDESGEHPIGKCILVFAGGTASGFEEFIKPMSCLQGDPEAYERFKTVKGPDFVSRLRGTINVLGPNKKGKDDKNYILRRALLLRGFCQRKLNFKGNLAPVNENIVRAMLHVPEFKHGARSMEAILDMSRIEGNTWEPASLPSVSQLALHVDADAFIGLVLHKSPKA